jgi:uncharacterized protein (TIGR00251 family)
MGEVTEALITVRLTPRAHREEIVGVRDGVLIARVSTPPVDGRANRSLCRLLARLLEVPASRVTIVRGERSRDKLVRVDGISPTELQTALKRL